MASLKLSFRKRVSNHLIFNPIRDRFEFDCFGYSNPLGVERTTSLPSSRRESNRQMPSRGIEYAKDRTDGYILSDDR